MKIITIDYKPRKWAEKLHSSFKRYFSLIIHRRGGKTTGIINHFQRAALDDQWEADRMKSLMPDLTKDDLRILLRDRFYGIVYPTYNQAKTIAWDMMKRYAEAIPRVAFNESELTVKYPKGSKVRLFGSDNPQSLRGPAFWGLGFDEYSQQPSNIFSEVLSKALADHLGFAIFAGTIKGKNQLYRTNEVARANPNEWDYIWQDIDYSLANEEGITIRMLKQALEDDRKLVEQGMMTQEEFDQEWYLATEAAIRGAYYSSCIVKARQKGRIKPLTYDTALNVHAVMDLGVGQALAVGFFQRINNEVKLLDYWEGSNQDGIPQAVKMMKDKPYVYGTLFVPHDAMGTSESTGETRLATIKKLYPNLKVVVLPKVSVDDGINIAKLMFQRLWVDEQNCQTWLDNIGMYRQEWDDKRGMFKDNPYHDFSSHSADMFRYAALSEQQMTNEKYDPPIRRRYQDQEEKNPAR